MFNAMHLKKDLEQPSINQMKTVNCILAPTLQGSCLPKKERTSPNTKGVFMNLSFCQFPNSLNGNRSIPWEVGPYRVVGPDPSTEPQSRSAELFTPVIDNLLLTYQYLSSHGRASTRSAVVWCVTSVSLPYRILHRRGARHLASPLQLTWRAH